jgi:hypothetical protein
MGLSSSDFNMVESTKDGINKPMNKLKSKQENEEEINEIKRPSRLKTKRRA